MYSFPCLETPRLRLRNLVFDDAPDLLAMHSEPQSMQWLGSRGLETIEDCHARIEQAHQRYMAPAPDYVWAIELKQSSKTRPTDGITTSPLVIGICELQSWDVHSQSATMGYELCPRHRGHGYMTEALMQVLAWGFRQRELNRVTAWVHPDNQGSLSVLKRLGFQREGTMRQIFKWADGFHDACLCGLLAREAEFASSPG